MALHEACMLVVPHCMSACPVVAVALWITADGGVPCFCDSSSCSGVSSSHVCAACGPAFIVLQHTLDKYSSVQEVLAQELQYVAQQIQRAPDNESAWNYLWGLFALPGCPQREMGRHTEVGPHA